ncbi:MAG: FAD-dependent oxidoreductase [Pseudomonadales bacterium]|nr:FAD-dependent oxidoreductase [Pseudomonadales bacterium]
MSASGVSRRWVLSTLAAVAASSRARAKSVAQSQWDLIIVGAGTAGLPAALFAARRGARVLVLEKGAQVGGTLWFSGGQMSAAGTRLQKAKGIEDSPAEHLADIMRISRGTANEDIVRLAVENAAGTVDWLESAGLTFGPGFPVAGTGHEPYSHARVWGAPDRGLAILRVLEKELTTAPASLSVLKSTEVVEPILDRRGAVLGVIAKDEAGVRRDFRAPHTVLASGGYMANTALFQSLNGVPKYRAAGWPMNTGVGIDIGRSAGGWVRGRENYLCDFGSIPADLEIPSPELARSIHHPERREPWEIIVNRAGKRFLAEDLGSVDEREHMLLTQPDNRYWLVFDEDILRNAPPLVRGAPPGELRDWTTQELADAFGVAPAFTSAATLEQLAVGAGIDPRNLVATVDEYNAGQASGHDSLGRTHMPRPIKRAPFYAIRHQGATLIGVAGLAVDDKLRVTKPDGAPVAGLYAAGELLGNGTLSGKAFCAGMMVTPALSFGRWLGENLPLAKRG